MLVILGLVGGVLLVRHRSLAEAYYQSAGEPYHFGSLAGFRAAFIALSCFLILLPVMKIALNTDFQPLWFFCACTAFLSAINSHKNTERAFSPGSAEQLALMRKAHFWLTAFAAVIGALGSFGVFSSK